MIDIVFKVVGWVNAIIIAIIISICINAFLIQPYTVSGQSMEPTLEGKDPYNQDQIGDRVLVFKTPYHFGIEPSYGDMVIIDSRVEEKRALLDDLLDNPIISLVTNLKDMKQIWVKRVIGRAGDKIEYKDGIVYRNNEKLEEDYLHEDMRIPFESVVVPEGYVFVMGDNRNYSSDSRDIGPVPVENVIGKVVFRMYPLSKLGTL